MRQREFYKAKYPEKYSDTIIIDKVECPKDYLEFQIEHLVESNSHFDFENFVRKLLERTVCQNLIEETGPAPGGDGKVDTENYPVSREIQEKFFYGKNYENDRWAFAISLRKDWKEKAKEDIKKIVSTKRKYSKIFIVSGCSIKNRDREDFQDKAKTDEYEVILFDRTWIVDRVLLPQNLDLLPIIHINQTVKEVRIGKNDYDKKQKLDVLEKNIKTKELSAAIVNDAIESAILSQELELEQWEVFAKYDRAYFFAQKINDNFLMARVIYNKAWYSNFWLEDQELFNKFYYDFYSLFSLYLLLLFPSNLF